MHTMIGENYSDTIFRLDDTESYRYTDRSTRYKTGHCNDAVV